MRVKSLALENYRRFGNLQLDFAKRLNVIVGVNGAGKSTILSAVSKMMSWYVRRLVSPAGTGTGFPIDEDEIKADALSSSVALCLEDAAGNQVSWQLNKNAKGAPIFNQKSDLKELNEYVRNVRETGLRESVPIIVDYSVNRAVVDVPLRIRGHHDFSVLSVYDDAFGRSADFRRFFEWFREYDDIENERIADTIAHGDVPYSGANRELTAVRRALQLFLPEFRDWKIRRTPLRMIVQKADVTLNIDQLSDGEKCIIAMVGDLARRLVMANPKLDDPLTGCGIALIDEVELHLHPAWQKSVLPRLLNAFPNLQFIVTTHSPLVVAQLNAILFKGRADNHSVSVFALRDGIITSLLDPETGLVMAGEMDAVAQEVDDEFNALLEES